MYLFYFRCGVGCSCLVATGYSNSLLLPMIPGASFNKAIVELSQLKVGINQHQSIVNRSMGKQYAGEVLVCEC